MKKLIHAVVATAAIGLSLMACKDDTSKINMQFPENFDGKKVELISYLDSIVVDSTSVSPDGRASFVLKSCDVPTLLQVVVEGRVRGFVIDEPGNIVFTDSVSAVGGTPLNDKLMRVMLEADSIDNLDVMSETLAYMQKVYKENPDNAVGYYMASQWMRFANCEDAEALMAEAPAAFRDSWRAKKLMDAAKLRGATAPGNPYVDFDGLDASGYKVFLSQMMKPGTYTLVDFWASWCPYCIKELPELKELNKQFGPQGLNIIGVAVRDKAEDTAEAVKKHEIPWQVMYQADRRPYDIYGFGGIPHHLLIAPDGTIVSQGESASELKERLTTIFENNEEK